ncbi:MAG: AmmeMemoRadiSam system protein B [Candidatus Cloacimonas sp.]|jgi:AmmeMemoRadiSam system protein B|nr:AmmeMemoRadiSam system protein B [Candidatus Cloacimonas sp.]
MIRNPAHAGTFYPRFGDQIKRQIEQWLAAAPQNEEKERALGLILPHAGYMYSGQCAALGMHSISKENIDCFIILHPSHSGQHFDFSISPYAQYSNPLGSLMLDNSLYNELSPHADQNISLSFHQNEHSMEIQLPLISYFYPQATILPIMIGNQIPAVAMRLAEMLYEAVYKSSRRIVILCSTDLSHYHSADKAEKLDRVLLEQIIALQPDKLWQAIMNAECEACGIGGIMSLLYLANKYSNPSARIVQYTHSGMVSGNNQQVVGYLAAKIWN